MKKHIKKIAVLLFTLALFAPLFSTSTEAATGYQGYAIYRDGVFYGYDWHAGMMDDPYRTTTSLPVLHAPGSGSVVSWDSWSNFMKGNNFKGVYRPNRAPTSSERDLFVSMGRNLRTENIAYNVAYQVYYDTGSSGTWVDPSEISSMRCDGVVEYIHEWYGFRIYGSDTYWDVTRNSFWGRDHHSGTAITPKKQVGYMTLVKSTAP
ncbi:hypothetical protein [Bacillus sp. FJAT-27245]|uniref:hypothetical protein n=1 Tax=Bacillus sp. FJAT-27245 TaxID=1684144 RepID=UPI0006A76E22|nr:hypothetical protein [Bacillus sp. FJAT-27245]